MAVGLATGLIFPNLSEGKEGKNLLDVLNQSPMIGAIHEVMSKVSERCFYVISVDTDFSVPQKKFLVIRKSDVGCNGDFLKISKIIRQNLRQTLERIGISNRCVSIVIAGKKDNTKSPPLNQYTVAELNLHRCLE